MSLVPLRRILLIEDNPRDIELITDALEESNLANKVFPLRNGAEALDYLFQRGEYADLPFERPAVILLDLKMPKVDGLEVLREIKGDPDLKTIPVVVMTSSREEPDLTACYELGVNAYVVKPVTFIQFVDAVKQIGSFWAVLNELPPHVPVPSTEEVEEEE